jgi:GNAT superfamily N-acetyltransferase
LRRFGPNPKVEVDLKGSHRNKAIAPYWLRTSMQIRQPAPSDYRRLAELHVLVRYDMAYLPKVHSFASVETWMRETVLPRQRVWVAEIDGEIVGYASLGSGFLTNLYVHPSRQRRGIGAALLAEVKKFAPDGFRFWVFEANRDAIRFYERHGARTIRITDGAQNEEKLPDRLMCLGERESAS